MHLLKVFFFLILFTAITHVIDATLQSDAASNQVKVQFDWSSPSQWDSDVLQQFKSVIARLTGELCQNNLTDCGMSTFSDFTANDVIVVSGYPQMLDVNSLMMSYVVLPNNTAVTNDIFVVRKAALTSVIVDNRVGIQSVLITAAKEEYEAAFRISYVNDVLVLPPSDQTLNLIITPIACGVVLVLVILVIGLDINKRMRRKSEVKAVIEKESLKRSKESSVVSDKALQASNSTAM